MSFFHSFGYTYCASVRWNFMWAVWGSIKWHFWRSAHKRFLFCFLFGLLCMNNVFLLSSGHATLFLDQNVDALVQQELPKGEWFCSMDCTRINSTLQKLLLKGAEKLPDSLLDVIKRKEEERGLQSFNNIDVRWRLLSGKITSPETRFYLSEAVAIFHVSSALALCRYLISWSLLYYFITTILVVVDFVLKFLV